MKKEFKEDQTASFYQLTLPKNEYHKYYRQNLIPSHLNVIKYNLAYGNQNLLFFEISTIYNPSTFCSEELLILSGIGKIVNQPFHSLVHQLDFHWIKGALENIFWCWRIENQIHFKPASLTYLSTSQRAEIFLAQQKIGFIGQVNSQISQNYRISEPVFAAQISLTKIFTYLEQFPTLTFYQPLSVFPCSEKDLSFIFPVVVDYSKVIRAMKKVGGEILQEVRVFDVYQNAELIQQEKKSVSFHLIFQSFTRTLETLEIEKITQKIGKNIEEKFRAKLRDKTTKLTP